MHSIFIVIPIPRELLHIHSADLSHTIILIFTSVTNVLYAKGLIPFEIYSDILTTKKESGLLKASKLVSVLQR